MEVGEEVWVADDGPDVWIRGTVKSREGKSIIIQCNNGQECVYTDVGRADTDKVLTCNMWDTAAGPTAVSDLISVTHLHEPAILHVMHERFEQDVIYTSTGPILLAVNPFKSLDIYGEEMLRRYEQDGVAACRLNQNEVGYGAESNDANRSCALPEVSKLEPHVFAVADRAYRSAALAHASLADAEGFVCANQAILVSGESGAGKTESTKYIMRYIATVAGGQQGDKKIASATATAFSVEQQVLESNPILESFGNARTTRNDNSSRFGKFIQLQLDLQLQLVGANVDNYLLEKVRVVLQARDERNFHIFYEMIAGASIDEREHWQLGSELNDFEILRHSGCFERQDGVCDGEQFVQATRRAMTVMGMTGSEQSNVLCAVAAVLHIGNITFVPQGDTANVSPGTIGALEAAAALLQLVALSPDTAASDSSSELVTSLQWALCKRRMRVNDEWIEVGLNVEQAEAARDALCKAVYSSLFQLLVARVNESLHYDEARATCFIGVLDIYGFEVFDVNGFEQLCINFTNEALQQHFNQFIFEMEQEEYTREGLEWTFIGFPDNQQCLDLIEAVRPPGIFSLIDEVCIFPKGDDAMLARKLYENFAADGSAASQRSAVLTNAGAGVSPGPSVSPMALTKRVNHPNFVVEKTMRVRGQFVVKHYAANVTYETKGMCGKNKDALQPEAVTLLDSSRSEFVRSFSGCMCGTLHTISGVPTGFHAQHQNITSSPTAGGGTRQSASFNTGNTAECAGRHDKVHPHRATFSGATTPKGRRRPNITPRRMSAVVQESVGNQYRSQLSSLLMTIRDCTPHFVRCIKSNDENRGGTFDRMRVVEQLRYGGVLAAVRVARAGFPQRFKHSAFIARYRSLAGLSDTWVRHQRHQLGLSAERLDKTACESADVATTRDVALNLAELILQYLAMNSMSDSSSEDEAEVEHARKQKRPDEADKRLSSWLGSATDDVPKADASKTGVLEKKGRKRKNWKHRFFRLRGRVLEYFSNESDSAVKGHARVIGVTDVPDRRGKRKNRFDVACLDRQILALAAPSPAEKMHWLEALTAGATSDIPASLEPPPSGSAACPSAANLNGPLSECFRKTSKRWGLQFGDTKVFFRQSAYDSVESLRSHAMSSMATLCAAYLRGWLCVIHYRRTCCAICLLQRVARVASAYRAVQRLRRALAATVLQKRARQLFARRHFQHTRFLACILQRALRCRAARDVVCERRSQRRLNTERLAAITLQAHCRKLKVRKKYYATRVSVLALQCMVRRFHARAEAKGRRADLRNTALLHESMDVLKAELKRSESMRTKAEAEIAKLRNEVVHAKAQLIAANDHVSDVQAKLEVEVEARKDAVVNLVREREARACIELKVEHVGKELDSVAAARKDVARLEKELAEERKAHKAAEARAKAAALQWSKEAAKNVSMSGNQVSHDSVKQPFAPIMTFGIPVVVCIILALLRQHVMVGSGN